MRPVVVIPAVLVAAVVVAAGAWLLWPASPPEVAGVDGPKVAVPSGMEVTYVDTITGERSNSGLAYRFRFVAPAIARDGGSVTAEGAQGDMQALCDDFALDRLPATGPQPNQIIISLSDRPVTFGEAAPEATQFFEAYRPENGKCVWEFF